MRRKVEVQVEGESIGSLPTPFVVGRDPECDVILPDSSVSRRHLRVTAAPNGLFVEDMGSSNGTWLDGKRVNREIVAAGHPFIIGRVSVALRYVDGKEAAAPYKPPAAAAGQASKHETMAVDIPQNFFDPKSESVQMRLFECPSCSRRLRCQAATKRVKCRNCSAIIRFVNDVPQLESGPMPPDHAQRPSASPEWVADARQGRMAPERPRSAPEPVVEEPPATFLGNAMAMPGGAAALAAVFTGLGGAIFGAILAGLGKAAGMPVLIVATLVAVIGFVYLAAGWSKVSGASGDALANSEVEDRLARLARLRREGLISEEDYAARKGEILRDI